MSGLHDTWPILLAESYSPSEFEQIIFLLLIFVAPALVGSIPAAIIGIVANIAQKRGCLGWIWIPVAILIGVICGGLGALAVGYCIGDLGVGGGLFIIAASFLIGGIVSMALIVASIIFHVVTSRRRNEDN